MAEPQSCLTSNSGWPIQAPRDLPTLQQRPEEPPAHKFQALKDWNWFQAAPTSPWAPDPRCTFSMYAGDTIHHPGYHLRNSGQNQWRKRKKQKEPEFSHFCDTCDRGFKNLDKYNEHIAQHVKCSFEDCKYTANEKLVKTHWKNSHAPGTRQIKLDTPEEIAKWREERKRNYPTQSNIKKKIKLNKDKEKRGDVLETFQLRRCGNLHRRISGFKHICPSTEKVKQPLPVTCSSHNVDPLGTLALSDPDSEKEESGKEISVAPKKMTFALGSLMSTYGEDMTESDEEREAPCSVKKKNNPKPERRLASEISYQIQHPQSESHPQQSGWSCGGRKSGRQHNKPWTGAQRKCHPTLLEMLLAPDIRHERNVVLQCIRYIVQKEFFGLVSNLLSLKGD